MPIQKLGGVDINGNRHILEEILGKARREEGEYRDVFNRRVTMSCRKLTKNCHFILCQHPLVKETNLPADCQNVYARLTTDKNFPIGVQFDWRNEE